MAASKNSGKTSFVAGKGKGNRQRQRQSRRLRTHFDILPVEIIHEILCRLPVDKVFQVESVCRSWYTIISSSRIFQKLWQDRHSENWLVMDERDWNCGDLALFNTNTWFNKKIFSNSCWRLIAAAGGLLVYNNTINGMLRVVNPLTMQSRQLSDPTVGENPLSFYMIKGSDFLIDLSVDSGTTTYKIIIFGFFSEDRDLLIYRSAQLSWEIIMGNDDIDTTILAPWLLAEKTEVCNDRIYCLELVDHKLSEIDPSEDVVDWGYASRKGRNIMVAHCWGVIGRIMQIIYELDEDSGLWNISSVCRRNSVCKYEPNYVHFGELLYEKEFPVSCGGGDHECIWVMPAETEKQVEEMKLELELLHQQNRLNFKGCNYRNSTAFPTPLRFLPCP